MAGSATSASTRVSPLSWCSTRTPRLDALRRSLAVIASDATVTTRDVLGALRLLLDVEKREAALLGLDVVAAPAATSTVLDVEIARLTREIGALDSLPVPDAWERADWTPQDAPTGDRPSAEVVRLPRRGVHP